MSAPHGPHGDDGSARDPAAESERQLRYAELEAAVEDLRAQILDLGATEAIPEKAATEVAGALPAMPEDALMLNLSLIVC